MLNTVTEASELRLRLRLKPGRREEHALLDICDVGVDCAECAEIAADMVLQPVHIMHIALWTAFSGQKVSAG